VIGRRWKGNYILSKVVKENDEESIGPAFSYVYYLK
jgi:hypothetical protein